MSITEGHISETFENFSEVHLPRLYDVSESAAFEAALTRFVFDDPSNELYADSRRLVFETMIGKNAVTDENIGDFLRQLDLVCDAWKMTYFALFHPHLYIPDGVPALVSGNDYDRVNLVCWRVLRSWFANMYDDEHPYNKELIGVIKREMKEMLPRREGSFNWLLGRPLSFPYP